LTKVWSGLIVASKTGDNGQGMETLALQQTTKENYEQTDGNKEPL